MFQGPRTLCPSTKEEETPHGRRLPGFLAAPVRVGLGCPWCGHEAMSRWRKAGCFALHPFLAGRCGECAKEVSLVNCLDSDEKEVCTKTSDELLSCHCAKKETGEVKGPNPVPTVRR